MVNKEITVQKKIQTRIIMPKHTKKEGTLQIRQRGTECNTKYQYEIIKAITSKNIKKNKKYRSIGGTVKGERGMKHRYHHIWT